VSTFLSFIGSLIRKNTSPNTPLKHLERIFIQHSEQTLVTSQKGKTCQRASWVWALWKTGWPTGWATNKPDPCAVIKIDWWFTGSSYKCQLHSVIVTSETTSYWSTSEGIPDCFMFHNTYTLIEEWRDLWLLDSFVWSSLKLPKWPQKYTWHFKPGSVFFSSAIWPCKIISQRDWRNYTSLWCVFTPIFHPLSCEINLPKYPKKGSFGSSMNHCFFFRPSIPGFPQSLECATCF